jgi:PleD family two-component response regulator
MILLVADEAETQHLISTALHSAGYQVTVAPDGAAAMARVDEATPDLILSRVTLPEMDDFELLRRLRADPVTAAIPVILLAAKETCPDLVTCLDLGADDCLTQPVDMTELLLRVRVRIDRPLLPRELLRQDPQTGLLSARAFEAEVERERSRARGRGAGGGCLAYLKLEERPESPLPPGARARNEIARQVATLLQTEAGPVEIAGRAAGGRFALLLPQQGAGAARRRLEQLSQRIAAHAFVAGGERVHLTLVIGHARLRSRASSEQLRQQALAAVDVAHGQLDRRPIKHGLFLRARSRAFAPRRTGVWAALCHAARTPVPASPIVLASLVCSFLLSVLWGSAGTDLAQPVYLVSTAAFCAMLLLRLRRGSSRAVAARAARRVIFTDS